MSYSKMLLPFILMLYCWSIYWVRLTMGGSSCPAECTCRWKGGKDTVECANKALVAIPVGIDVATQVVNISDNNLQNLSRDIFLRAKLLNLQRIYMSNCNIGIIQDGAFNRLTNLVELDLSSNLLVAVPTNTFKDIPGLRRLLLSKNPIQRIDNNAFVALLSLVALELSHCQLESVAPKAFHGLKGLNHLKLDNNRLMTLSGKSIQPLKGLHGVDLHGNPWKCDCSMQDVKVWLSRYNIPYKLPPTCSQPSRLKGFTLDELQLDDLACQPQSMYSNRRSEVSIGRNASLVCEVQANPSPTIQWFRQGHPVANLTRFFQGVKMYVIYERGNTEKASILTITAVTEQDSGDYLCVAENKAGTFSANFTLEVTFRDMEASGLSSGQIAGISLGLILVGAIVSLLICILLAKWRQSGRGDVKHPPLNQSQHKLMNSVNHVDYKGNHQKNSVKMSFSLPRLSRSNSTQRNYSDEASDSDRTLIDNLTSPSKSSTCNLSNKPDVVNVERSSNGPLHGRSKKESRKKEKRQEKKQKEKRKERHRLKEDGDETKTDDVGCANKTVMDNRCNSVLPRCQSNSKSLAEQEDTSFKKARCNSDKKLSEDDNRYGSFGNLKLSSSNEWNKVITNDMIENAGFTRDHDDGPKHESYELIEKSWGMANHCGEVRGNAVDDCGDKTSPSCAMVVVGDATCDLKGNNTLSRNSNARFRHYVPVLPPLPAQHYSQVRNSLIRPCKDSAEDITDM